MQTDKPNCVLFPTCFGRHEAIDIFDCMPSFLSSPDSFVVVDMLYGEKQSMYRHPRPVKVSQIWRGRPGIISLSYAGFDILAPDAGGREFLLCKLWITGE